ncbi:hypothetical protein PR048_013128 [Dryococelus australis]|uniref:Uncharacterized protein n=1 Tax=Dryococelus australis TaxID=614101 RepID=A0ABQ9HS36_9NEOP|nr:hypothetical protein PR048_013128 [Dryococelus australis]
MANFFITTNKSIRILFELQKHPPDTRKMQTTGRINSTSQYIKISISPTSWKYCNTNWPRLNKYITRNINCEKQLINPGQVQEYTEQLTNVIQKAIEAAIPLTTIEKRQIMGSEDFTNSTNITKNSVECKIKFSSKKTEMCCHFISNKPSKQYKI